MSRGEREQLRADRVAARGEAAALERLHPQAVQREREQRGVVEIAGEAFGLARLARRVPGAARLERDRGQQRRPRGVGQLGGERAARGGDDLRRLLGVVGTRPDRGDVVRADHPRGEQRVAELLRGGDRREPMRPRLGQPAAARHGQAAQEAHGRFQPRLRARPRPRGRRPPRPGPRPRPRPPASGSAPWRRSCWRRRSGSPGSTPSCSASCPCARRSTLERVAAPPVRRQREREQAPALLAPRVRGDVRVEVGHGLAGPADAQPRVRHRLHREQAQLRQPAPFEQCPVLVVEFREGRPAPPRQRLEQPLQPPLGRQVLGDRRLEPPRIDIGPHAPIAGLVLAAPRPPAPVAARAPAAPRSPAHREPACAPRALVAAGALVVPRGRPRAASRRSAYPAPSVTSSPRAGPSARRRSLTNVRTAPTARGGGSGHRSSTRRATDTTSPRATISRASTARCRGPLSAIRSPASHATTGPSTPNSTGEQCR